MKKYFICFLLALGMNLCLSGAELLLEITPDGKTQTTKFQQTASKGIQTTGKGLAFAGNASVINFNTPKPNKNFMNSFTFISEVTFNAFAPAKKQSVIVFRPGYNNVLAVDFNGYAIAACWYTDREGKKKQLRIWSKRKLKLNRTYLIASVTESRPDGTIHCKLLVDGLIEAEKTVTGELYPYPHKLSVGNSNKNDSGVNGTLHNLKIYNGTLTVEEIVK